MKLTKEEKEQLQRFPKYDGKGEFVGTRDYWEAVFEQETNRDPELHEAFGELHTEIVNMVIRFCKEHNLNDVDEFSVHADGIVDSLEFGEWCPCTDSSMKMVKVVEDKNLGLLPDRKNPFLYEI